jgi:hypothetical protein
MQVPIFDAHISVPDGWEVMHESTNHIVVSGGVSTHAFRMEFFNAGVVETEAEVHERLAPLQEGLALANGWILKPFQEKMPISEGYLFEMRANEGVFQINEDFMSRYYWAFCLNDNGERSVSLFCALIYDVMTVFSINDYVEELVNMLNTLAFNPRKAEQPTHAFTSALANTQFHFMESYNSGNQGGGYNTEEKYVFYENGTFYYDYSHVMSAYSFQGMSLGGGTKSKKARGRWEVAKVNAEDVLHLYFEDGAVAAHPIRIEHGFAYLSNQKYHWLRL